ncbi:MAG TPA: hypothetical protein PLH56_06320 [Candidatus Omnitrophota bacterium]|nr:hypothetical protein [Candidatus Omnitrophota bacterium]
MICSLCDADTIELKSGAFFEGTVIEKTETFIILDTGKTILKIKTNEIENIITQNTNEIPTPAADLESPHTENPIELQAEILETPPSEPLEPIIINPDNLPAEKDCPQLSLNLQNCAAYKCAIEDPLVKGFISEHTIYGLRDNYCLWKQTLPHNGIMRCRLSEDLRTKIAAELKSDVNNSPSLDEAFKNDACHISGYEQK